MCVRDFRRYLYFEVKWPKLNGQPTIFAHTHKDEMKWHKERHRFHLFKTLMLLFLFYLAFNSNFIMALAGFALLWAKCSKREEKKRNTFPQMQHRTRVHLLIVCSLFMANHSLYSRTAMNKRWQPIVKTQQIQWNSVKFSVLQRYLIWCNVITFLTFEYKTSNFNEKKREE